MHAACAGFSAWATSSATTPPPAVRPAFKRRPAPRCATCRTTASTTCRATGSISATPARSTHSASASTSSLSSRSSTAMHGRCSFSACVTMPPRPRPRRRLPAIASGRSRTGCTPCAGDSRPPRIRAVQAFGSFDYVIVGAGSAGCLLANRLSRDTDTSVLLIEAGGRDNYFWIPIPVGYLYTIANPRTDWCYKTEPDEHLAGRSIHYARGRVLGGCSSINAMIYMRGQKEDWDHWAALGNRGWAWDDVLPVFKSLEDYERGATDGYGAGGEVRIEDPRVRWEIIDAWRTAAAECGIPPVKVFNNGDNFGCAYFQMNQKRGRRWSATNAFLRPVLQRPNLTVLTDAMVTRVRMQGRTAEGVEYARDGQRFFAAGNKETILAAGAIGSPQLLQLSGIGPAAHLQRLGIAVVHELKGVGENLQDHLQIRLQYKVKNVKTLNGVANSLL